MPDQTSDQPMTRKYVTPQQILDLWRRGSKRLGASRKRIMLCGSLRKNLTNVHVTKGFEDQFGEEMADTVEVSLPERETLEQVLKNLLSENEPTYERTPLGTTDTAVDDADKLEVWINSVREQHVPWDPILGKAVEDGEWGMVVLPDTAHFELAPRYLGEDGERPERRYDRDRAGKAPDSDGYGERHEATSKRAYADDYESFLAEHPPWVVRLIPALDCAPTFVRGVGRRRFELAALVVRTLYDREELLRRKYQWVGSDTKRGILVPKGFDSTYTGKDGQLYLYEAYISDPDGPYVAYCIGGNGTWSRSDSNEQADLDKRVKVIDLKQRYGITEPTWGYWWGLHTEDDDPDHYGRPYIYPVAPAILNTEMLLTSHLAHTVENAFAGYWHIPDSKLPPEVLVEAGGALRTPQLPKTGEVQTATGQVIPAAQARVSDDATRLEGILMGAVKENTDESLAGSGESGHAMVVGTTLQRTAKRHIRDGSRQCVQFIGECILRIACALVRKDGVEVPVAVELPESVDTGEERVRRENLTLNDRWVGSNYSLRAVYAKEGNLAEQSMLSDQLERGQATWEEFREAKGDPSPATTLVKIAAFQYWRSEAGQMRLQLLAARRRGDRERAQQLEMQLAQSVAPGGTPTDALATPPTPGQMPGTGVGNMADDIRGGVVAGEMGQAAHQADAAAQMQIAPSIGANGVA